MDRSTSFSIEGGFSMNFRTYHEKRKSISGKTIIGIDPGKERHQAAVIDEQGIQKGKSFSFKVSHEGFNITLWKRLEAIMGECSPEKVVFAVETSCNLGKNIVHYLSGKGYPVFLVSPLTIHHSRPLINHDFSRTDPKDALLIATNAYNGNYDPYQIFTADINRLHQLSIAYDKLFKDRTKNKLRLRAFMEEVFPEYLECFDITTETSLYLLERYFLPEHFLRMDIEKEAPVLRKISMGHHGEETLLKLQEFAKITIGVDKRGEEESLRLILDSWILQFKQINSQMKVIIKAMVELAKKTEYFEVLTSIEGIADISAERFIAECRDLGRYSHYKQIEKFAGWNLRQSQSGKTVGCRHISHIGNRRLSHIIYQMTVHTARTIPEVRSKFLRRQLNKRSFRKNIVAASSQLLKLIMALIKQKRRYRVDKATRREVATLERKYAAACKKAA
jgi:transposase